MLPEGDKIDGGGGAFQNGAKLAGAVLMLRYGKEDRRVADRVDYNEMDDKCRDEGFDIPRVIRRQSARRPPLTGDIYVKFSGWRAGLRYWQGG